MSSMKCVFEFVRRCHNGTYKATEELYKKGKIRAIGVSNKERCFK